MLLFLLPTHRLVDLPVPELALLGAVVHLATRTAHHLAGPELKHQALGADALARADGGRAVERGDRGRGFVAGGGVVLQKHTHEHPAHELEAVLLANHPAEAEVLPDLPAKDPAEVGEVGVHHAAEEQARAARKLRSAAVGVALLLHGHRHLLVHEAPHVVGLLQIPDCGVERLERWRLPDLAPEEVEGEVCVHGRALRPRRPALQDADSGGLGFHVDERPGEHQPAQIRLVAVEPVADHRRLKLHVLEDELGRERDAREHAVPD